MSYFVPTVIEQTHKGERAYDIWSRLMKDRIIFLGTKVDDNVANSLVAQMLFLESEDSEREISLYINSPGGSVSAGMAIYDTMQYIKCPVRTICFGMAASMGAVLLAAGEPGMRLALPNSRVMIHQPLGGTYGQASDIEIQAAEMLKIKKLLTGILAEHSGQSYDKVSKDCDRDYFMTATEAQEYGLIDMVIRREKLDDK